MEKAFKYDLGATVALKLSGESGEVIGRAEYSHCENSYYVRYVTNEGCQVECWIGESALKE